MINRVNAVDPALALLGVLFLGMVCIAIPTHIGWADAVRVIVGILAIEAGCRKIEDATILPEP